MKGFLLSGEIHDQILFQVFLSFFQPKKNVLINSFLTLFPTRHDPFPNKRSKPSLSPFLPPLFLFLSLSQKLSLSVAVIEIRKKKKNDKEKSFFL